jgi:F-type H+-transporting ATPase subunit b|tara:strand:+ start:153 stop:644 length:492 start_codon:yes stop_codon:yes gene_type:complete
MFDATFWVAISFVLFVILILYKKVPKFVLNQIDTKILELKNKIDEAENLKSSSEKLLSSAQGKLEKSEKDGAEILKKAQIISENEIAIATEKMQRSLENKETAAFTKIKQAKNDAINQIKKEATEIAIETVKKVIIDNIDIKKQEEINLLKLKNSISKLENTN